MGKYLTGLETDFISKTVDLSKTSLVLDVGAEAGRFSLMASASKMTVVGIDIDAYSLRRLKLKEANVAIIQADARNIPIRNACFDAVFMEEGLNYIPQLVEVLTECNRVRKPKSVFVVSSGTQSS